MIWNLGGIWLVMAVGSVVILSYFFGTALNALMQDDGFGAAGNAAILSGSFFLAILLANYEGHNLRKLQMAIAVGLAGAFIVFAVLTLAKAVITRMLSR